MGFVWNGFGRAINRQKGIIVSPIHRFEDLGPGDAFPNRYVQGDRDFEFRAIDYYEWRRFTSYNGTELQAVHTATYIVGNLIADKSLKGDQEFKRNIKHGMLALVTRGGFRFRIVPNFGVEFVDSAIEVPGRSPRPTNVDDVMAASISHQPLVLGDKKDIEFVYEDYGAHDASKGITITSIHKFEEISFDDPMPYIYAQGERIFEFRASRYREWRLAPDGPFKGKLVRPHTATYVIEESIKQGMIRANCPSAEYQELKQHIKDGMWVAETRDGRRAPRYPRLSVRVCQLRQRRTKMPISSSKLEGLGRTTRATINGRRQISGYGPSLHLPQCSNIPGAGGIADVRSVS